MKSLLPALLCLFTLTACRRESLPGPPKAVAVRADGAIALHLMSFNIRYENGDDRGSRSWRERLAGAVKMIRREAPDVIGVQEALHGQAADLWVSLPGYTFFGIGRDDGLRAGEYSGIFYRNDRFRPDAGDQGTFWLSDTPETPGSHTWGNEIPRVATWMRLTDLASDRGFYVFDTHFDHRSQESRERAALLIAKRIDARAHPDEPVILLGDLNSFENNASVLFLTGRQVEIAGEKRAWRTPLLDAYQSLHPREKDRRTAHFWRTGIDPAFKLDYIFVSPGARIESADIVRGDKPPVSDHYPVTARILFPPP